MGNYSLSEFIEIVTISLALRICKGNRKKASEMLGITARTIRNKIDNYPELVQDCNKDALISRLLNSVEIHEIDFLKVRINRAIDNKKLAYKNKHYWKV